MKFASHCKRIKVIPIFLFLRIANTITLQFFVYDFIYLKFKIVLTMIITQRQFLKYGTYEIYIVRFFLTRKSFYLN